MRRKQIQIIIILAGIALAGMVIAPSGYLKPLQNSTYRVSKPFLEAGSKTGQGFWGFFSSLANIKDLEKRNQQLEAENRELKSQNAFLNEVKNQNEILKRELGFIENKVSSQELVPAQVIGYSPSGFLEYILIDKGKKEGIKDGLPVISQGYLIGRIGETEETTAKVFLIVGGKTLIPVLLQESRGTGLLRGGLSGLLVYNIATDTEIKIGENVVTSAMGGVINEGVLIGSVDKIISSKSAILQNILIKSPIEFGKLEIVFVQK